VIRFLAVSARLRLWGLLLAAVALFSQRAMAEPGKAAKNQDIVQADIVLSDGTPVGLAKYVLRGKVLTITLPRADDGAWAGLYRLKLDDRDALAGALAHLPATVAGPPAMPGMSIARISLVDHGKSRDLVATLPTTDPALDKLLLELRRREASPQNQPTLALSLDVVPPLPAKAEQTATITVRVTAKGERGAEATLNPGQIRVEAAPEPKPVPAGFMPLPPRWVAVNMPFEGRTSRSVQAGATSEVKLAVKLPSPEHRWFRAFLEGDVSFRTSDGTSDVRVSLSSKPVRR
jgi:hypothetical protein